MTHERRLGRAVGEQLSAKLADAFSYTTGLDAMYGSRVRFVARLYEGALLFSIPLPNPQQSRVRGCPVGQTLPARKRADDRG